VEPVLISSDCTTGATLVKSILLAFSKRPEIAVPHPNLGTEVRAAELYDWVRKHAPPNVDDLFIAGNGWRTIGVIAALGEYFSTPHRPARALADVPGFCLQLATYLDGQQGPTRGARPAPPE
jgi:hypothetical protein